MRPFISVAIATYNGENYITEQMDSILKQLPADAQVIVSDDGSTDGTIASLRKYEECDGRVKLIDGPHQGPMINFERALGFCTGDIVFLADQDDVWFDDKVEKVLAEFEKNPSVALVIHDAKVMNGDLTETVMESFFDYRGSKAGIFHNWLKNSYMGCCMAFRQEVLSVALPIPRELPMHDQWIGMRSEKFVGKSLFLKEPLLLYRRHGSNASDFKRDSIPKMIRKRLDIIRLLSQKNIK